MKRIDGSEATSWSDHCMMCSILHALSPAFSFSLPPISITSSPMQGQSNDLLKTSHRFTALYTVVTKTFYTLYDY